MAASETLDDIKSKGILWVFGVLTLVVLVSSLYFGRVVGERTGPVQYTRRSAQAGKGNQYFGNTRWLYLYQYSGPYR